MYYLKNPNLFKLYLAEFRIRIKILEFHEKFLTFSNIFVPNVELLSPPPPLKQFSHSQELGRSQADELTSIPLKLITIDIYTDVSVLTTDKFQ